MSKKIHPTAIIDPGAELGEEIEIGPYVVIDGNVRLGDGCRLAAHVVLTGPTTIGQENRIGYGTVIGSDPQDFSFDPETFSEVRIGDRNIFREHVTIHRGTKADSATVVGDDCYLMSGAHMGHNSVIGSGVVIANNCLLAGYVEIQDRVVLGGGTVFHQFMRIGRMAMVRGGTRFGKDIPPFSMGDEDNILAGINAVGLRRNGISPEARRELARAFKLIFRSGLNVGQALEKAQEESWGSEASEFFDFIRESKRGVCPCHQRRGGDAGD